MAKLLDGLMVLDFTWALSGPFCTMTLADMGARVIKVEMPEVGDGARQNAPFVNGRSAYFTSINRGKESITINLKHPKGKELVERLTPKFDVLVENFRPGVMNNLGLGYPHLSTINPRLIYLSLSGFGQKGPYASLGAFDIVVQAMSGVMSINGPEGGSPTRIGVSIGDIIPAQYAATGILGALYRRSISGKGCYLDLAMLDCLVAVAENALARYWATGVPPKPLGNRHPGITPFDTYHCADGYIAVAAGNDSQWQRLCRALSLDNLATATPYATNELRTQNAASLTQRLNGRFQANTTTHWLARLQEAGVPCAKVSTLADVVADEHLRTRNMMVEIEQPYLGRQLMPGTPIKGAGFDDNVSRPAPDVGEHTDAVLREFLGLSEAEVDELRIEGAV